MKSNQEIAREIVQRELAAYYVSPRPEAERFDLYEAIAAALDAKDRERIDEAVALRAQADARALRAHMELPTKGHVLTDDGSVRKEMEPCPCCLMKKSMPRAWASLHGQMCEMEDDDE